VLVHDTDRINKVAAHPLPGSDSFLAVTQTWSMNPLRITEISGGAVTREKTIGESPPFDPSDAAPTIFLWMMMIQYGIVLTLPLILAVVLSVLMRRDRIGVFTAEEGRANHASIARRAVAQLIDGVVVAGPMPVAMYLMMSSFWEDALDQAEGFWDAMITGWPFAAAFAWAVLLFLVFVVTEGRWGITPGKLVARIRVLGTDLEPCGFGRALVRNLLKFIDGFFNFLVGIMVVALSENWQRLGDMAARTVVVDVRRLGGAVGVVGGSDPTSTG
jgi:uncharacterized RDD family membrane protein YckC